MKNKTYNKKKILVVFLCATVIILALVGRLIDSGRKACLSDDF